MTCEEVRQALLELPIGRFAEFGDHLGGCAGCAALARRIRDDEEVRVAAIEAFVDRPAPPLPAVSGSAGRGVVRLAVGLAIAAALLLAVRGTWSLAPPVRTEPAGVPSTEAPLEVSSDGFSWPAACALAPAREAAASGSLSSSAFGCLQSVGRDPSAPVERRVEALRVLLTDAEAREDDVAWRLTGEVLRRLVDDPALEARLPPRPDPAADAEAARLLLERRMAARRRPPPPDAERGVVVFTEEAGLTLRVDGGDRGPLPTAVLLPPGPHRFEFVEPDGRVRPPLEVMVEAGQGMQRVLVP